MTNLLATNGPTAVHKTPFRIAHYRGGDGLVRVKDDWDQVVRGLDRPRFFHLYEWYWSYLDALEPDTSAMHFFIAYRDGEPVAVFPLRSRDRVRLGVRLRLLELPQHPHLPLADFIGARTEATRGVLSALMRYLGRVHRDSARPPPWDYLSLPSLLGDSFAMAWLKGDRPPRWFLERTGTSSSIPIPGAYGEIEKNFSKNFRGDLRKARNKLHATPSVTFESSRDRVTLARLFDEFLEVESSGWKGIQGTRTAIKLNPDLTRFYRNLIATFGPIGACEINLLRAQGKCLAGQFCLRVADVYYVLKIGYDEAHSRLAPGNMLMEWLLQRLVTEGEVQALSLVTGLKWHQNWKPLSDPTFSAQLFRPSSRGLVLWASQRLRRRTQPRAGA